MFGDTRPFSVLLRGDVLPLPAGVLSASALRAALIHIPPCPVWFFYGTGVVGHFTTQERASAGEGMVHSIQDHKTSKEKEYTNVYCRVSY